MATKGVNVKKLFFQEGKFKAILLREYVLKKYDIVFCEEQGFYIFNGEYWKLINYKYLCHILDEILAEETGVSRINETMGLMEARINQDITIFNKNKNRLVLKNGTLDISDWIHPVFNKGVFFKEDYATIQLNVNYYDKAQINIFKKYLDSTFDEDLERINLVGEMLGYCLQPKCNLEKAFILYGQGGNGKSKLLNIIDYIWTNNNISEVPMNELDKPFSRSSILGKLINKSSELESKIMNTAFFKALVSGEFVNAQFKFKNEFKFKNTAKLIFSMNTLPKINDRSDGLYRRIITIPFLNKFEGENKDIELDEKLQQETDGVFLFALEGLKRLAIQKEFTHSIKVDELLETLKRENNPIEQFTTDSIQVDINKSVICKDLYLKYSDYCKENGFKGILNNVNFGKEIIKMFGDIKRHKTVNGSIQWVYDGIDIK